MRFTKAKLCIALSASTFMLGALSAQGNELEENWNTLETYCMDCHNFEDYAGGVDFSFFGSGDVGAESEIFERVLKKMRGSVMPPPSQDQPSVEQRWAFIHSLENALDAHAQEHPEPGRIGLHRLNRTEYVNAIYDITGLQLDTELVLPKDDNSDGFDTVANVLKISPSFLDQYISAARTVANDSVGDRDPRNALTVYGMDLSNQGGHVDGLPLGTRGGVLVEHVFPVDGEYAFNIEGMASAGYVMGMEYEHTLVLTIDGEKVFERNIGGGEDFRMLDQEQAPAVAEINGRFRDLRFQLSSGVHEIGVAFIARSFTEGDEFLHSLSTNKGMGRIAMARALGIQGPITASGEVNTPARNKVMICEPADASEELACAKTILSNLAKQAYRRSLNDEDMEAPLRFFVEARESGSFDDGIKNAMMAIFTSPKFLFRTEVAPEGLAAHELFEISDLELASRLSFFLWSTPPDIELIDAAESGELKTPQGLDKQVARMLASPKAKALVENFVFQWLRLRDLENVDPDPEIYPNYNVGLLEAFKQEVTLFVDSVIAEDKSIHELVTADYTYLNEDLALHYGIADVKGDQFRRVTLKQEERFGLLGTGAVLMVTSYANRTTPVIRGAYILENFQGVPPANPPPNVEAFPETEEGAAVALTVRERLEVHRDNPACAGCHDVMDPLGLALENFNAIGEWRERDSDAGNALIDSSGQLADGSPLKGINELRNALVARPEQFAQIFTEKMFTYALGRVAEHKDMPAVRKIVHDSGSQDYSFSSIVTGIINSEQFRQATTAETNTHTASITGGL